MISLVPAASRAMRISIGGNSVACSISGVSPRANARYPFTISVIRSMSRIKFSGVAVSVSMAKRIRARGVFKSWLTAFNISVRVRLYLSRRCFMVIMDAAASRISFEPVGVKPGASNPRPNRPAAFAMRRMLRVCMMINGAINIDTINIEPINHMINTSVLVEYMRYKDEPNVVICLLLVGTSINTNLWALSMYMFAGRFKRLDNSYASLPVSCAELSLCFGRFRFSWKVTLMPMSRAIFFVDSISPSSMKFIIVVISPAKLRAMVSCTRDQWLPKNAFATITWAMINGINIIKIVRHKKVRGINLIVNLFVLWVWRINRLIYIHNHGLLLCLSVIVPNLICCASVLQPLVMQARCSQLDVSDGSAIVFLRPIMAMGVCQMRWL